MLKNLYIRKNDTSYWERAEKLAEQRGVALSVWVTDLIRSHLIGLGTGEVADQTPEELADELVTCALRVQARLALMEPAS